jgi:hypothetical protein
VTDDPLVHLASLPPIDTSIANVARAWNYMVGGKDNFEIDREAVRQLTSVAPVIPVAARSSRAFLGRVVRYLAADAGIRQFLDVGTGLPTAGNTHEVAQDVAPASRVVYVDNDPVVSTHARALLVSGPQGATSYLDADARDPGKIITEASVTLNFDLPVAIIMVDLLDFIEDDSAVRFCLSVLLDAVASGSFVAIMHPASDLDAGLRDAAARWNAIASQRVRLRSRSEILSLVEGLDLIPPGLVTIPEWRPDPGDPPAAQQIPLYGVVARKP